MPGGHQNKLPPTVLCRPGRRGCQRRAVLQGSPLPRGLSPRPLQRRPEGRGTSRRHELVRSQTTCAVSPLLPHDIQGIPPESWKTCLFARVQRQGTLPWSALQVNICTLRGTVSYQIIFHAGWAADPLVLSRRCARRRYSACHSAW